MLLEEKNSNSKKKKNPSRQMIWLAIILSLSALLYQKGDLVKVSDV